MLANITVNTVIPVIASFDAEGRVKPLYVRIGELSLKVHSSWLKPSFAVWNFTAWSLTTIA